MVENIRLALYSIKSHTLRSALTMLGIVIGIASIIAIVSTIRGTNEQIQKNLIGAGNNSVDIELYHNDTLYDPARHGSLQLPLLNDHTIAEISNLSEVSGLSLYTRRNVNDGVKYGTKSLLGGWIFGVDTSYFEVYGYRIVTGRGFVEDDYTNSRKVALADKTSADALFPGEDPVGKIIEIYGEPFTIIGVTEQSNTFSPTISNIKDYYTFMNRSNGYIFVTEMAWPILYGFDEPRFVALKASTTENMTIAGKKAADIINGSLGLSETGSLLYKSEDLLQQARELQELAGTARTQLVWIAGISLLAGGVGVMNIMLVSVTERVSEIGLRKALGARKRLIMVQFLTEAAVMTGLGGAFGVLVGLLLAAMISRFSNTPASVSIPSILIAVVFSTFIGILFGIVPALKAANQNPIDALRTNRL